MHHRSIFIAGITYPPPAMSIRVVARIRPLLQAKEIERDIIVDTAKLPAEKTDSKSVVRIPNPRNEAEAFSFVFNSVYDQEATQAQLFENEGESRRFYADGAMATDDFQCRRRSSICSKGSMSLCLHMALPARARRIPCAAARHWQSVA